MKTRVLTVDLARPEPAIIEKAAAVLRGGGLVAFPTETVYGLGANALDAAAVRGIFAAKGRPAHNPLIVHAWDLASARALVASWTPVAERLATRFWPGPLTLVLTKAPSVPDEVTSGGATVAVRVPAHPVALALLRSCQLPLAAPSANRSSELSPTRAEHVMHSLGGRIPLILDAGRASGGLESTVIDLTSDPPRLLRPGLISLDELQAEIGAVAPPASRQHLSEPRTLLSPGQLDRHYAPRTPLEVVEGNAADHVGRFLDRGMRVGWLCFPEQDDADRVSRLAMNPHLVIRSLGRDAPSYSAAIYAMLHDLDALRLDRIIVSMPPATEAWRAVRDRLARAATSPE